MAFAKPTNAQAYYPVDEVALVHSGNEYFERVCGLLRDAKEEVHFHNYIFHPDDTGRYVAEALMDAALRGVKVYVLLDSFGSALLRRSPLRAAMQRAGIALRFFSPHYLTSGFRVGRRMHQKVLVVDGAHGIVSGINVSDDYRGTPEAAAWLDYGVYVRGAVCKQLVQICTQLENNRYTGGPIYVPTRAEPGQPLVRFRQSDYLRNKRQISRAYRTAIADARHEIIIVNAYFLPGTRLRLLLERAARRGVKIYMILSARSDVPFVKPAMNWYYDWLIRNKVSVYEYTAANVHAKTAVFDGELVILGSYNLNYLSEYLSVELNADVRDAAFARSFAAELKTLMREQCTPVDAAALGKRFWSNRLLNYISYRLLSWSMRVMYLALRKDRINELE